MPDIQVTEEVFAMIWAARRLGEPDENAILIRVFNLKTPEKSPGMEMLRANFQFVSEQDGKPERKFKDRLLELFKTDPNIFRAYLVLTASGPEFGVALCLRTLQEGDVALLQKIKTEFQQIFSKQVHLDIMFLDQGNEDKVLQVARPFFNRPELGTL